MQRCQNTTVLPANLSLSVYAAVFQDGSKSVGLLSAILKRRMLLMYLVCMDLAPWRVEWN